MEWRVFPDSDALAKAAVSFLLQKLGSRSRWNLGLATGSTPKKTYAALAKKIGEGKISLTGLHCFHLDEYSGMVPSDSRSFSFYIQENIVRPLHLSKDQVTLWQGDVSDRMAACKKYEEAIETRGGIDCQILGLGINGHIGFNEPGATRESWCREVRLTLETLTHNTRDLEGGLVPTHAMTLGIGNILEAREILLLVTGKNKRESLSQFLAEKPSSHYPSTFLKEHPHLTIFADRDAVGGDFDVCE